MTQRNKVPLTGPMIGVDPSFRYCGLCLGEAPEGFYTKEHWSEKANRMYSQQYAYAVEFFKLHAWDCIDVSSKELAKITPDALPPAVEEAVEWCKLEWMKHCRGHKPRVTFELSFTGIQSWATTMHLMYVGALYSELYKWTEGDIITLMPAQHQRFFYRYAGVRLYGYTWDPKSGRRRTFKEETQELVDQLHDTYWQQGIEHPVSVRHNRRTGKRATIRQYAGVADAVSTCVTGLARWTELRSAR